MLKVFWTLGILCVITQQQVSCPDDPNKAAPGFCGCGIPETDSDFDGWPDCVDVCPNDSEHSVTSHFCGCGIPEIDDDNDLFPNCVDECKDDPDKVFEGQCGCGVPDTDRDEDGTADCNDQCPDSPENSPYCGTFLPCEDPKCIRETEACSENETCNSVMPAITLCEGKRSAQQCWSDLGKLAAVNQQFETLWECFHYCRFLGQCETQSDCQNGGICLTMGFGARFCRCPEKWLGWDCSIEADFSIPFQSGNIVLSWSLEKIDIYFQLKCLGEGYCAFQIGDQVNPDINAYPVTGSVAADGTIYMADTHSPGDSPTDDFEVGGTFDCEEISGWRDGEFQIFRWKQKRDTGDHFDWVFRDNERVPASYAHGSLPLPRGMDYHGLYNREFFYIDFSNGIDESQQPTEPPVGEPPFDYEDTSYECSKIVTNSPYKVFWTLSSNTNSIEMSVAASISVDHWMGFGFARSDTMEDGDVVISLANGDVQQFNTNISPRGIDKIGPDDIRNAVRIVEDGILIMQFERNLDTNDATDIVIQDKVEMNVIWAFGPQEYPDYHETNRGWAPFHFGICDEDENPAGEIALIWTTQPYDPVDLFVGHSLELTYYPLAHNIYQFKDETAYQSCDFSTAVQLADELSSPFVLIATPDLAGETIYLGCNVHGHCDLGQKLIVNIVEEDIFTKPPEEETSVDDDCSSFSLCDCLGTEPCQDYGWSGTGEICKLESFTTQEELQNGGCLGDVCEYDIGIGGLEGFNALINGVYTPDDEMDDNGFYVYFQQISSLYLYFQTGFGWAIAKHPEGAKLLAFVEDAVTTPNVAYSDWFIADGNNGYIKNSDIEVACLAPTPVVTSRPTHFRTTHPTRVPAPKRTNHPTPWRTNRPTPERTGTPTIPRAARPSGIRTVRPAKSGSPPQSVGKTASPTQERIDVPTKQKTPQPTIQRTSFPTMLKTPQATKGVGPPAPPVVKTGLPTSDNTNFPTMLKTPRPTIERTSFPTKLKTPRPTFVKGSFPKASIPTFVKGSFPKASIPTFKMPVTPP